MDLTMFRDLCQDFKLERGGKIIREKVKGFFCSEKYPKSIQILGNYDIQDGDWLIEINSNKRCFIEDIRPIANNDFMAKYKTELEVKHSDNLTQNIYINQTNSQAIIGDNSNITIKNGMSFDEIRKYLNDQQLPKIDKENLELLIATVEEIVNNNKPVSKGVFNRFLSLTEKYSGVISVIMQPLLNYLFFK